MPYSEELRKQAVEEAAKGKESMAAVARKFGLSPSTVQAWISKAGIKTKERYIDKKVKKEVLLEVAAGAFVRDVAEKYGVATTTVRGWIRKEKLPVKRKIRKPVPKDYDWEPIREEYGMFPDTVLAEKYDLPVCAVHRDRTEQGIDACPPGWDENLRPGFPCKVVQDMWEENYQIQQLFERWGRCSG